MKWLILIIIILSMAIPCGKIFADNIVQSLSATEEFKGYTEINNKEAELYFGGVGWSCWPNANTLFLSVEFPISTTYTNVINFGVFPKYLLADNYDRYLVLEYSWKKYFRERKANRLSPYGGVGIGYYWKTEKNAVLFDLFPHSGPYLSLTAGIAYPIVCLNSLVNFNIDIFLEAEYWIASDDNNVLFRIGLR